MSLHAVILAGGSGTRFWPLSRAKKPKQFLALVTERTLIAETFARVAPLCPSERTWVVCGKDHVEGVRAALPDLPVAHLIVEPVARNTAPAIGLACVHALREDRAATLMVLPSDHHVGRPDAFRDALALAAGACQNGDLLTLGIKPTRPETGYGYLRRGAEKAPGVFAVEAFVEKPDAATAGRYLQDPSYSWNAGIFVWRDYTFRQAVERFQPELSAALDRIAALHRTPGWMNDVREILEKVPAITIDVGIAEAAGAEAHGSGREVRVRCGRRPIRGRGESGSTRSPRATPSRTTACSRLPPASARSSLRLPAAAEAQR